MNNNKNNILNNFSKKHHTVFIILIIVLILAIVIFIIRNNLKHNEYKNRFVKNVFFVEMDNSKKKPYDASLKKNNNYELDKNICVRGNNINNYIQNNALHVKLPYSLMFWFNINSDKVGTYLSGIETNDRTKYPLVYFSNRNYEQDISNINVVPAININIINNVLEVMVSQCNYEVNGSSIKPLNYNYDTKQDNDEIACGKSEKIYNISSDTWNCITAIVSNDHLNLYLNGKLTKVIEYNTFPSENLNNYKLYVGPFPGEIAYLQIDNNNKNFSSEKIYEEYLFYKNKVDTYIKNQYHKNYKVSTLTDHSNYNFSSYNRRPQREDKSNICN